MSSRDEEASGAFRQDGRSPKGPRHHEIRRCSELGLLSEILGPTTTDRHVIAHAEVDDGLLEETAAAH